MDNTPLYVCREIPDRSNPRARDRFAVRQDIVQGREIAVVTLTGYRMESERSPQDWANLFAASPDMLTALEQAEIAIEQLCMGQHSENECWNVLRLVQRARAKARGIGECVEAQP